VEFEATWTPFYAMIPADAQEVLLVGVLDTDVLWGGGTATLDLGHLVLCDFIGEAPNM
jgi:hypothetical protein